MASNHKEVFRLYGVRRPLKWRRRMARLSRRMGDGIRGQYARDRGSHERWTDEAHAVLWLEAFAAKKAAK